MELKQLVKTDSEMDRLEEMVYKDQESGLTPFDPCAPDEFEPTPLTNVAESLAQRWRLNMTFLTVRPTFGPEYLGRVSVMIETVMGLCRCYATAQKLGEEMHADENRLPSYDELDNQLGRLLENYSPDKVYGKLHTGFFIRRAERQQVLLANMICRIKISKNCSVKTAKSNSIKIENGCGEYKSEVNSGDRDCVFSISKKSEKKLRGIQSARAFRPMGGFAFERISRSEIEPERCKPDMNCCESDCVVPTKQETEKTTESQITPEIIEKAARYEDYRIQNSPDEHEQWTEKRLKEIEDSIIDDRIPDKALSRDDAYYRDTVRKMGTNDWLKLQIDMEYAAWRMVKKLRAGRGEKRTEKITDT